MKHVYRGVVLFVVFIVSTAFMQRYMKDVTISFDKTVAMGDATFPLLYIQNGDSVVNEMHGYSSSLGAMNVRESMTFMDGSKKIVVRISDKGNTIRKIKYETRLASDNEVNETGSTTKIEQDKTGKYVTIELAESYQQGKEYAMKLIAITEDGKKINYYTRIKFYQDPSFFDEKIDFVQKFHNATFDKAKMQEYSQYLENGETDDTSLSYVDIRSDVSDLTFGDLKPKAVSKAVPRFTEYTRETASVVYQYYVKANTGRDQDDLYYVNEYIRIRYANNRMYLLAYQRTMEEIFNSDLADIKKNALKVGITNDSNMVFHSTEDQSKLCFQTQGALWYYDTVENRAVKVFSYLTGKQDLARNGYQHYGINVMNMDKDGNIDFMVYGYINRGDYEGRVGVVLYKFHASENRIQELVYIPMETTYEMLKENINNYGYLSSNGVFFFAINNNVYSYNIASRNLKNIAKDVLDENIIVLEHGGYLAWQESSEASKSKKIYILNMETEEQSSIAANKQENVMLLGSSGDNIIFGTAKTRDIKTTRQGEKVVPYYKITIANSYGKALKTYSKTGIYIDGITVNNNVISLNRIKKSSETATGYAQASGDSIINNEVVVVQGFKQIGEISKKAKKEYYFELPSNVMLTSIPKKKSTMNTIVTTSTTLVLEDAISNVEKYYVLGYGTILGSYSDVATAIIEADKSMGAVMDNRHRIIWERGGKYLSNSLADYKKIQTTGSVDSIGACISMVLEFNGVSSNPQDITTMKQSIDEILRSKYKGSTYNLTGCNLDEALYYVSAGVPVIALKSSRQAVLLVGYDEYYVRYYDPAANMVQTMLLTNADSMFKANGSVFNTCLE